MAVITQTEQDEKLFAFTEAIADLEVSCYVDFKCFDCFHKGKKLWIKGFVTNRDIAYPYE